MLESVGLAIAMLQPDRVPEVPAGLRRTRSHICCTQHLGNTFIEQFAPAQFLEAAE